MKRFASTALILQPKAVRRGVAPVMVSRSRIPKRMGRGAYVRVPRPMSFGLNRRGVASKESGFVDLAQASYALDTTGSITLIATVAQGASVSQRVGKKIVLKSLQSRGFCNNNSAGVVNDVAFLIVYDKRPTGSLPAVTDVLNTVSSASFNNDANSGRFMILKRCDFILNGTSATTMGDGPSDSTDFYLNLRNLPTVFKAAGTGAIGDIEQGALYLITVGSNTAGTTAATLAVGFRTRFVDV
ncbi:capsid [uncultured virus]|uniref:Capsid n=1 Tax=uncultured virus TaxID=340016 RepID=A0A2K9LSC7_9VIRU|nr:capsid [uncultured virus]